MNFFKHQDWYLNGAVLFLAVASLAMLFSINETFFWRQISWWAAALIILIFFSKIDWRPAINYKWITFSFYALTILLLVITLLIAPTIRNAKSWIVIGPMQFQASEIAKAALIIVLAYFLAKRHIGIAHWQVLLSTFIYFLMPVILVLAQPDLGTALILFSIWGGFLLVSGVRWRHLLIGFLILILVAAAGWQFFLRDYQKTRITALFNPEADPLGVNYSVIQSKIAIGSAGFWGKGFNQGTQVQLGFLPEAHGDFILAAFIEEWGLIGGIAVIGAFILILFRIIKVGLVSEDNFTKLLCLGTVIMFLTQFILNVGSNLGFLPVVGVSFPFFSYGGSNLLTNMVLVGIIQSAAARQK